MRFRAEHYLEASQERIDAARRLYNEKHYAEAVYFAGVGVECLLLAYRIRENPEFESRHDLRSLFKESGIAEFITHKERIKMPVMLGEVWSRWKNNYRFASSDRLTSEFKRLNFDRGIRGDILKSNSFLVICNALEIISIGVKRWN